VILATSAPGCVNVTLAVVDAPLPSVTVTVYNVATKPVAVALVCAGVVLQEYVYPLAPPVAVTVAAPVVPLLHAMCVEALMLAEMLGGCVIVTLAVSVQLLASVTVTWYVFAARPVAVAVV
jgi:hypothetical protein